MKLKNLLICSLGNVLEWMDFGLFIFLAPIIGKNFFPLSNSHQSLVTMLSIFAAGFICRPIGGMLFGCIGDREGRSKALRYSVLLISLSTILISLLPSYNQWGIFSSILFILIRLAQGLSIGGEYSGTMIYLAESAQENRRGFITSFAATGANLGFFLATLCVFILKSEFSQAFSESWGWRLAFLLMGLLGCILTFSRLKLPETQFFSAIHKLNYNKQNKSIKTLMLQSSKPLLLIFGLTSMSATYYYVFFGYMPHYLNETLGFELNMAFKIQLFLLVVMLFLVPLMGLCGDYIGRKKMLLSTAIGIILFSVPCFYLIHYNHLITILISLIIATFLSSMDQGNSLVTAVEICPAPIRYSGVSFSYNLGMSIFGGTAPLVITLLTANIGPIAPAYYLIIMAGISLCAILFLSNNYQLNFDRENFIDVNK